MSHLNCWSLAALSRVKEITDARIVAALGLKKSGRNTVMTREHQAMREKLIALDVAHHHRPREQGGRGQTLEVAYESVATAWGINSDETVRSIWRRRRR